MNKKEIFSISPFSLFHSKKFILVSFLYSDSHIVLNDKHIQCSSVSSNAFLMTMLIYISIALFQISYLTSKMCFFKWIKIIPKSFLLKIMLYELGVFNVQKRNFFITPFCLLYRQKFNFISFFFPTPILLVNDKDTQCLSVF